MRMLPISVSAPERKTIWSTTLPAHGIPATCTGRRLFSGVHQRYCASDDAAAFEPSAATSVSMSYIFEPPPSLHLSGVPAVRGRQKTFCIEWLGLARGEELSVRLA